MSKTYQKEISKQTQFFASQSHIKICVTSVFHLNCAKKYTKTTLVFRPAKWGRKKYLETTSIFRSSKLRLSNYVEATSIFWSPKSHRKDTSKWREIGNLSIFSFRSIDVISASNWHRFDVVYRCVVTMTKGWLRWLTNLSFADSRYE